MGSKKGTRSKNIRQMRQAIKGLEVSIEYLVKVGSQYEQADPDIYDVCCKIIAVIQGTQAAITSTITEM